MSLFIYLEIFCALLLEFVNRNAYIDQRHKKQYNSWKNITLNIENYVHQFEFCSEMQKFKNTNRTKEMTARLCRFKQARKGQC